MNTDQAWRAALRAEHVAVYGFGIVGGRLGPADGAARTSLAVHRWRRDYCVARLVAAGTAPEPAAAAYRPRAPVTTDQQARALATAIEQSCSVTYLGLVVQLDVAVRRVGTRWLRQSAVDQTRWSGAIPALPGLTEQGNS